MTIGSKIPFNPDFGNIPMETQVCVFNWRNSADYILGIVEFCPDSKDHIVRDIKTGKVHESIHFPTYQEILNENGGYYFWKGNPSPSN